MGPGSLFPTKCEPGPNYRGELRESRTGLYLIMGKAVRPIGGQQNGFEKAHNTSLDRMTRDPAGYVPANLIAYKLLLAEIGRAHV